ncbi:MAG TPA: DUF3142 domain-containing protein [Blastocatellia bacterium]|nr:DUF3142 domain-containing protein [Blastocatellia bacterium]
MRLQVSKRALLLLGAMSIAVVLLGHHYFSQPRVLAVSEVPIAFWAWRTNAPNEAEIHKAFAATNAKTLFLRAGQFDLANNSLQRIRPVSGTLPTSVELHLVYNATRPFLRGWEQLEPSATAANIANTFRADLVRASNDHARVVGLQLDFDAPTRLLPQYANTLRHLRELLPPNIKLSITGLPTWANSHDIKPVLTTVDFWIPQCYGTTIPTHVKQRIPISSPSEVARTITKMRRLDKPFYAGLSAYSYAILYAKDGGLLELRGDLDPAWAAHHTSLELIERQAFKGEASEMRYVYRAKSDVVLDGLIIKAGESLVFDLPSAASLRASARAVRENAGEQLLGICVFRVPMANDETTLSSGEIAAALQDAPEKVATALTLQRSTNHQLQLRATNIGTASAMLSNEAFTIDLAIPAGSLNEITNVAGFAAYKTLCRRPGMNDAQPCSERRANELRLRARAWKPDSVATMTLSVKEELPATLAAVVTTRVNDGRIEQEAFDLQLQNSEK